jgi:hypothetical protein
MCDEIGTLRRYIHRYGLAHIVFLDESHIRLSDHQITTIVPSNVEPIIDTKISSSYGARYDCIACCSGVTVFPLNVFSPSEREKGITAEMLLNTIRDYLAQALGAQDIYPIILIVDRAKIHQPGNMLEVFHDWGCQELTQVILMPTASGKRMSPLDNCLFAYWKEKVLDGPKLTVHNIRQRMNDAWDSITPELLFANYKHCALLRSNNVYVDCPYPSSHQHTIPSISCAS